MRKLTYTLHGKIHIIPISDKEAENQTFADFFNNNCADLKESFAISCDRVYESGSKYHYPKPDWGKSRLKASTCVTYQLNLTPYPSHNGSPTITKETTTMTQFTGVKEQMKHEIFGTDINTASKDQLIELAAFINKKIAAAQGLNLSTSKYVRSEIASLEKLLGTTVAKLDEGVEV